MVATHVCQVNAFGGIPLAGSDDEVEDELVRLLGGLDGTEEFSFVIWKLPAGKGLADVKHDDPAHQEYMQCAGAFTGRLTCEIRVLVDGELHQYVLGRSADEDSDAAAHEVVHWGEYEAKVRPNEVLTGDEVAELFVHYYRTGTSAPGYTERTLDL